MTQSQLQAVVTRQEMQIKSLSKLLHRLINAMLSAAVGAGIIVALAWWM